MKVIASLAVCVAVLPWSATRASAAEPASARRPRPAAGRVQGGGAPGTVTDPVRRGEFWFYQRCSLCHLERIVKDEIYMPLGPSLKGLLTSAPPGREAQVREFIKSGTLRMPGFRYGLDDKELDELIAFLKTQ